ncbi:MAG: HAMP domain-containing protein [Bacteroidota bacterium]
MKRTSLTEKMVLYFLALGIGSIVITGIFSFITARKALLERTYDQLTSLRLARQMQIETFFSDRLRETAHYTTSPEAINLAKSLIAGQAFSTPVAGSISQSFLASGYYSGILILDKSGKTLYENRQDKVSTDQTVISKENLFNNISSDAFIIDYRLSSESGKICLLSAGPIKTKGNILAYFVLILKPGLIDDFMLNANPKNGLGYSGETYLVGSDYLMRSPSRFISNAVMKTYARTIPAEMAQNNTEGITQSSDYRGIEVLSSFGKINIAGLDWVILAEIDYEEATKSVYAIRNNIILLTIFTGLAFFIISYIISRKVTRPLVKLKDAAIALGEGRLNSLVGIDSNDEVGELTEAFNRMVVNLQEKEEALRVERGNRLRSAIDGQDQERQRLSRELHDGIGQSMIAIRLRLGALESGIHDIAKQNLLAIISLTDNLIDDVRAISNALMPPALAEFGLTAAIQNLCNSLTETYGIDTDLEGEIPGKMQGRKARLYIFRIFQEALNNVAKHSGAKNLKIVSVSMDNILYISITDDGSGFDMQSSCVSKGHGINNIIERASLLKGKANVRSTPGKGTTIAIEIPINKYTS